MSSDPAPDPKHEVSSGGGRGSSVSGSGGMRGNPFNIDHLSITRGKKELPLQETMSREYHSHNLISEKLGAQVDIEGMYNRVELANNKLPREEKLNTAALQDFLASARTHMVDLEKPLEAAAQREALFPKELWETLRPFLDDIGKKAEEKMAAIHTMNLSDGLEREQQFKEIAQEYKQARADLVDHALYQSVLQRPDGAEHLYYVPRVRDELVSELESDLQKHPHLFKQIGKAEGMFKPYVPGTRDTAEQLAVRMPKAIAPLKGWSQIKASIETNDVPLRNEIVKHLEEQLHDRKVNHDNISISETELTNLLNDYRFEKLQNGFKDEIGFSFSNISKEARDFAKKFFETAEHDGNKAVGMFTKFGIEPGRVAVGLAGMTGQAVSGYWVTRIQQQDHSDTLAAGASTKLEDAVPLGEGESPGPVATHAARAHQKTRMGEYIGATFLGTASTYSVIDAVLNGPLSRNVTKLFRGK